MKFMSESRKRLLFALAIIWASHLMAAEFSDKPMPATDILIVLNRMDPVAFSHIRHLGAGLETAAKPAKLSCSDCHPMPFERVSNGPIGMEVPHESGGCAQCHNGKKSRGGRPAAFAANTRCLTCHKPPGDSVEAAPR